MLFRSATAKAMDGVKFTAERAREVSNTVLSAAVEAAEEAGEYVSETAQAAADGVHDGLGDVITRTRESIAKTRKDASEYTTGELKQIEKDLHIVGDLFVDTLHRVADRSGKVAKGILDEIADDARKAGSSLREMATKAASAAGDRLKDLGEDTLEVGKKATHSVADEASELGSRMVSVAKGAAVGMWEGARKAYGNDDEKEEK